MEIFVRSGLPAQLPRLEDRIGLADRGEEESSGGRVAAAPHAVMLLPQCGQPLTSTAELLGIASWRPSAMGKDLLQSEMPNWRAKKCKVTHPPREGSKFQIPNSKPVSSCRHATRHFSSVELRILEGLSRGVV
jgi:hypothetical protein